MRSLLVSGGINMKSFIKFASTIIGIAVGIVGIVLGAIYNYSLYKREFDAQIEAHGFYKSDVKILFQEWETAGAMTLLVGGVVVFLISVMLLIWCIHNYREYGEA